MVVSLCLLLLTLGIVLWQNRDFWFPDITVVESEPAVEKAPAEKAKPVQPATATVAKAAPVRTKRRAAPRPKAHRVSEAASQTPTDSAPVPPVAITSRTVLPPLEVEVVAGDRHRTIRPGSSSVRVELHPGALVEPVGGVAPGGDTAGSDTESAANVTSDAAGRVQMSTDTSEIVVRPVRPNYPLLARQMKVQGSVILQALIGKDGVIQSLRVVSGPHILASAARDAVRQWHFKPHVQGSEPVETEAKITVNFTISTN
jgi:protein TonB